ncbi:MAG: S41 family peptidase [Deltaproteobacteria bacterium]|nr:S41 family peptidase [Deltaproteobacteria bacterium]
MRTGTFILGLLLALFLLATGCGPGFAGPVETFEQVWLDYDEMYGPFELRNVDWDDVYDRYRPRVHEEMSDDELHAVLGDMISELDDGHVRLIAPDRPVRVSNGQRDQLIDWELFDLELVREEYLDGEFDTDEWEGFTLGELEDGTTYLHLPHVSDNLPALDTAREAAERTGRLILDLRHSNGGQFTYAFEKLAAWSSVDRPVFRSRTRSGPERGSFDDWWLWQIEGRGREVGFDTVVLVDHYTISASERMVMALKVLPRMHLVGETTAGAVSTAIGRDTLNGWTITISTQEVVNLDGSSPEGPGIDPDTEAKNDPALMAQGIDTVLDAGLAALAW